MLGATFQVLRRNPRPTFGAALLLNALVVIVAFGLTFGVSFWALDRSIRASADDAAAIEAGAVGLIIVTALIAVALSLVAQAVLLGVIVLEVSRATLGEKLTLRQLLALGKGRWWALIGWTALLSVALIIGLTLFVLVIALLIAAGGPAGVAIGVLLGVFGGLAFTALSMWLWIKLALVPTAIMLERLPLRDAIRRGWTLVRGHFWRTFGTLLLITVMVQVASSVVSAPFSFAASFGTVLVNPAGDDLTSIWLLLGANVLTIAVTVVVGAIGSVLLSAATALIYIDLRMRKEGLDLELQRVVELRASGASAPDPYQPAAR
ncbi:MAG: glycerophosphoryl diester phosphodiesterase membrane domain-containing protein [Chryseoglobus sp.]|nr:glycerophosphoryl diester phosphodiesterase membrane domain-containing protein [Microcella sp.]